MRALARTFTGGVRAFVSRTARALARFLDTPAVAAAEPAPFSMTFPARTRPQGGAATHMGPLEPESEEHNAETAGAKWYGSPTEIGIAQKMVEEDVPAILQDKRLVTMNVAQLVSGATAAEAQERVQAFDPRQTRTIQLQ